ncbi:MAG TPA: hypothetical protein VGL71_02885, partial [Urbifossiella sp.]
MGKSEPTPGFPIDVLAHFDWALGVARGVAASFRFLRDSQETADLEQVCFLTLLRRAKTFDPKKVPVGGDEGGLFRGFVHRDLQSECRREARRLRNGGTYRTRTEQGKRTIAAEHFSTMRELEPGRPFDILDHRDGADPLANDHEIPSMKPIFWALELLQALEERYGFDGKLSAAMHRAMKAKSEGPRVHW